MLCSGLNHDIQVLLPVGIMTYYEYIVSLVKKKFVTTQSRKGSTLFMGCAGHDHRQIDGLPSKIPRAARNSSIPDIPHTQRLGPDTSEAARALFTSPPPPFQCSGR